jgi:superfamily II DNA/RNA helicase
VPAQKTSNNRARSKGRPAHRTEHRTEHRSDNRSERRLDNRPERRNGESSGEFRRSSGGKSQPGFTRDDARGSSRGGNRGNSRRSDKAGKFERDQALANVVLQKYPATIITPDTPTVDRFQDLGLSDALATVLTGMGAASPFPIQSATIPEALTGRDILARGRTGSGKTIAFGAAAVQRLSSKKGGNRREYGRAPVALILAPTRELALQIDRTVQPLARAAGLFTTQIVGGVPQGRQVGALRRGVDIVIGTPGRLEDLIKQRVLDLSSVRITVVDEADHMAELGFLEPLQRLLRQTQGGGQKLFFSATLDTQVASLVEEFLVTPAVFELQDKEIHNQDISHHVFVINHRDKRDVVKGLAAGPGKTLVFTKTRAFAEELSDYLDDHGVASVSLHGDLNQSRRVRNLQKLTDGRVNVLVATDVAARGIHVNDIDLVIHADQPEEHKTYIHRSGRTGRAGATGTVVTLTTKGREKQLSQLLQRAGVGADTFVAHDGAKNLPTLTKPVQGSDRV